MEKSQLQGEAHHSAGRFTLPELADGFGGFIQPVQVSLQGDQLCGSKKFHHVRFVEETVEGF